ncbi:MAG: hypothetical protein ABF913_03690 [Oenococcus sp.]|uniref:hypothetical protein n=1 Tax=Oenococcus sp. TaxID=1979414 RepID=UPI0039E89B6D
MDENKVPATIEAVRDRVTLMNARGFKITEDEVIDQSIKEGLQAIVDELLDGDYFTIQLINPRTFDILGLKGNLEGQIFAKGSSFTQDFKNNADQVWDSLWDQADKIVGR